MVKARAAWVAGLLALTVAACTGTPPTETVTKGALQGQVYVGQNYNGTVVVYDLKADGGIATESRRTLTVDGGQFSFDLPGYAKGPILLVASGGTYSDLASPSVVPLGEGDKSGLVYLIGQYEPGATYSNIAITPFSTIHAGIARYLVANKKVDLKTATLTATEKMRALFAGVDVFSGPYRDLTVATSASAESNEAFARGLYLAGFSYIAKDAADKVARPTNATVDAAALANLLVKDFETNGVFDGVTATGDGTTRLYLPTDATPATATALDGQTLRGRLALAAGRFLSSARNQTGKVIQQFPQVQLLSNFKDQLLFGDDPMGGGDAGTDAGSDGGTGNPFLDAIPPTVTWITPSDDAGVGGNKVSVSVKGNDDVSLKSLAFTAPEDLVKVVADKDPDGRNASLNAVLDVSGLKNGPLALTVVADDGTNKTTKSITVRVANNRPTAALTLPAPSGAVAPTVSGVNARVRVEASFNEPATRIVSFTLVDPPKGMTMPPSENLNTKIYNGIWDTTQSPEGDTVLHFKAVDDLGQESTTEIVLKVNNYSFAHIKATVSLGGPVVGAIVEAVAVNAAGEPATGGTNGIPLGGRLGLSSVGSNDAGVVEFDLEVKNYEGPMQLRVRTELAPVYVDPYAGGKVTFSRNDVLTTSFASFKTNQPPGPNRDLEVPINGWTTLADTSAKARVTAASTYAEKLASGDNAVNQHFSTAGVFNVRKSIPGDLSTGTAYNDEQQYAAVADYMFPALARTIAASVGGDPVSGVSSVGVLADLVRDLANGNFNGKDATKPITVAALGSAAGLKPFEYDENTTRNLAAISLYNLMKQSWVKTRINAPALTSIYQRMSSDESAILYPVDAKPGAWNPEPSSPITSPSVGAKYIPENMDATDAGTAMEYKSKAEVSIGNGSEVTKLASTMGGSNAVKLRVRYPKNSANAPVRSVVARLVKVDGAIPPPELPATVTTLQAAKVADVDGAQGYQEYEVTLPAGTPFGALEYSFEATSDFDGKGTASYAITLKRAVPPLVIRLLTEAGDGNMKGLWNLNRSTNYGEVVLGGQIAVARYDVYNPTQDPALLSLDVIPTAASYMRETWAEVTDALAVRGLGATSGGDWLDGNGKGEDAIVDWTNEETQKAWYGGYIWQVDEYAPDPCSNGQDMSNVVKNLPLASFSDGQCHGTQLANKILRVCSRSGSLTKAALTSNAPYRTPVHFLGVTTPEPDSAPGLNCEAPEAHAPGSAAANQGSYATPVVEIPMEYASLTVIKWGGSEVIPLKDGTYTIPPGHGVSPAATIYVVYKVTRPTPETRAFVTPPLSTASGPQKPKVGWAYGFLQLGGRVAISGTVFIGTSTQDSGKTCKWYLEGGGEYARRPANAKYNMPDSCSANDVIDATRLPCDGFYYLSGFSQKFQLEQCYCRCADEKYDKFPVYARKLYRYDIYRSLAKANVVLGSFRLQPQVGALDSVALSMKPAINFAAIAKEVP